MTKSTPNPAKKESRAALVTGGAVRVGRAICERLASDFSHIAIHFDRSADEAEELAAVLVSQGARAATFEVDLTLPGTSARLVERVAAWCGRLDLLVNNAAAFVADEGDLAALARMKVLNIDAPASLVTAAEPWLERTGGSIVNIADIAGFRAFAGYKAYSRTKRALLALTLKMAGELAPRGIRVNAVCPGAVLFPEWYTEERKAAVLRRIPMGVMGSPGDVADAVAYLASAGFVTGQAISVDGGRMLVMDSE
jgi:pteridine reductase